MKIAIVGSGWSGLSCASEISKLDPHAEIYIFESAQVSGGRARGMTWNLENGGDVFIDNGQHFIIGAYKETLALIDFKKNSNLWEKNSFSWNHCKEEGKKHNTDRKEITLEKSLCENFFSKESWPLHWYFFLLIAVLGAKIKPKKISGSAKDWLLRKFQPEKMLEVFWRPLIESTTNTNWNEASAKIVATVINECAKNFPESLQIFHPKKNLSFNAINIIEKKLKTRGVKFLYGNSVTKIKKRKTIVNNKGIEFDDFNEVILSLPTSACQKIWTNSKLPPTSESNRWKSQTTRGINTLWIVLPNHWTRLQKKNSKNYWEIRQLSKSYDESFFVVVERPNCSSRFVISVVQSAVSNTNPVQKKNIEKIKIAANNYLRWMFNLSLSDCDHKLIFEKKATFASLDSLSDNQKLWGSFETGVTGIWRCSDDCIFGYPATIESAVRAGKLLANKIVSQ